MFRLLRTAAAFIAVSALWNAFGQDIIIGLSTGTPAEIAAVISAMLWVLFIAAFAVQAIRATVRPSETQAVALPLNRTVGAAARQAAVALHGSKADKSVLEGTAREIADNWAARPKLNYSASCRHEAAHAVIAHRFGAIPLKAVVGEDGNGHLEWANPVKTMTDTDDCWMRICMGLAGSVLDQSEGRHNTGSAADTRKVLGDVIGLMSTGKAPSGFAGELTLDSILSTARSYVGHVLASNGDALDAVARELEKTGELAGYDINRLLSAADRNAYDH